MLSINFLLCIYCSLKCSGHHDKMLKNILKVLNVGCVRPIKCHCILEAVSCNQFCTKFCKGCARLRKCAACVVARCAQSGHFYTKERQRDPLGSPRVPRGRIRTHPPLSVLTSRATDTPPPERVVRHRSTGG